MRTTDTSPASAPDLDAYLRVHRLLRTSARRFAESMQSRAAAAPQPSSGAPRPEPTRRDRAVMRWFRGFAGEIRCHHHIEDALLFPALRDRVAIYDALGPRLDEDHASLDIVLDALAEALHTADFVGAAERAVELRDHLDEHLGFEDDEVAPLFVRHFTAIEFDELNAKAVKMTPPRQLAFTAPWLMSLLDDAEQAELLASVPKVMTLVWVLTRGRYARLTARAFGDAIATVGR